MRITHKINPGLWSQERAEPVISDRYQAEIDASVRKAERAWKSTEKAARRADRQAEKEPSSANLARRDEARRLVTARLDELNRLRDQMTSPQPNGVGHSGRGSVRRITNHGRSL